MKIKRNFFTSSKGKFQESKGELMVRGRKISFREEKGDFSTPKSFYFDKTDISISYEANERKQRTRVNGIITESEYGSNQREYLVKLNFIQRQQLLWMFQRHWLQRPSNILHLVMLGILLGILVLSVRFLTDNF